MPSKVGRFRASTRADERLTMADFVKQCVDAHNEKRRLHGVAPVSTNAELNSLAQKWADHLAATGRLAHSNHSHNGQRLGENVATKWSSSGADYTGAEVVEQWYSEIRNYRFGSNDRQSNTGHFSQVVWKSSREIGVGKARSADGRVFVVADYLPAGNMMGAYRDNVLAPQ